MLGDREQQALLEVQRHLMAEDPDFARSFDEAGRQDSTYSVQWVYAMPRWVYTTAVVVADHLIRQVMWPESVYGVTNPETWRFLEHGGWVVFEDIFLAIVGHDGAARQEHR